MSEQKWLDAAAKYAAKRAVEVQHVSMPVVVKMEDHGSSVQEIATALTTFLDSSEGRAASALLIESRRHVILAESNEGGGSGCVIFYDGKGGIKQSIEPMVYGSLMLDLKKSRFQRRLFWPQVKLHRKLCQPAVVEPQPTK
jgi:hypothetical protein